MDEADLWQAMAVIRAAIFSEVAALVSANSHRPCRSKNNMEEGLCSTVADVVRHSLQTERLSGVGTRVGVSVKMGFVPGYQSGV